MGTLEIHEGVDHIKLGRGRYSLREQPWQIPQTGMFLKYSIKKKKGVLAGMGCEEGGGMVEVRSKGNGLFQGKLSRPLQGLWLLFWVSRFVGKDEEFSFEHVKLRCVQDTQRKWRLKTVYVSLELDIEVWTTDKNLGVINLGTHFVTM